MKFFYNKWIFRKLILTTVFVILLNFIIPNYVSAKSFMKTAGGKLLEPVCEFLIFAGDCIIDGLQTTFLTDQRAIIIANSDEERSGISGWTVLKYVGGVLAIVGGVATIIASWGTLSAAGVASIAGGVAWVGGGTISVVSGAKDTVDALTGEFDLPMISYTPYAIFSNSVPIFDINFFSPNTSSTGNLDLGEGNQTIEYVSESSASILQTTVATWYVALRSVALVGLLSVLIYLGIRIILSATSADKAKYKQILLDWLVAICLLFVLHYIMAFTITITEELTNLFAGKSIETILYPLPIDTKVDGKTLESDPETGNPIWAMNFVGYARLIAGGFSDFDTIQSVEFTLIYIVLVIYTVIFTIMYLKRVLYMAFLTMIAPLIALTYPIDKINDGKAQGFNTWLREYVFNALMQPFHLLLYTIIIGSVMDLAIKYPFYALVALGFMIPAEKLLRKIFGFEKAGTVGDFGALGVAGASMLMQGVNKLTHRPRKRNSLDENSSRNENKGSKIRTSDNFDPLGTYAENRNNFLENETSNMLGNSNSRTQSSNSFKTGETDNTMAFNYSSGISIPSTSFQQTSAQQAQNLGNKNKRILKNSFGKRVRGGIMAVGQRYSRKYANSHPIRALRRGVTYGLGAATLGMVGLAAGISTGDLGKTAQYTLGAGYVGGNLSKNLGNSLLDDNPENFKSFKQGFYGTKYSEHLHKQQVKQYMNNYDNLQYLRERYDNYKDIMHDVVPDYLNHNIDNIEDICAAYELEQQGMSRESAISIAKLAKRTGDITSSPKAKADWQKKLDEEFFNTSTVQSQYNQQAKAVKKQYQEQLKKLQESKIKDKEEQLNKIVEKRKTDMENLKTSVSRYFTDYALSDVEKFYKNKNK